MNGLVFGGDVIRDVEYVFDSWVRQRLRSAQRAPDERCVAPRRLRRVNHAHLPLGIGRPQFKGERDALLRGGAFAPLTNAHGHRDRAIRMIVREQRVVNGIRISIAMDEPGEARGSTAAAFARRGFLRWLKLNGQHAAQLAASSR